MDKELLELEAELKQLRPLPPSGQLQARIAAELSPRRKISWTWVALPLAAALVLLLALRSNDSVNRGNNAVPLVATVPPPVESNPTVFKPVATQNVLYATQDDGIVTLADGRQARRVSRSYVDTVLWRDPKSNASLTWSVPRREIRITPVSFQ
ncbi:MAG: hypothetical protein K9M98_00555 [Cephaloticoccus sp.]|nr:hypothetical protein [Cephaloticoccus sp.]MCF7758968.1 hypothetical protein [Cephaloticoccus sp.]